MTWPGERQRHSMSARGVLTARGRKLLSPSTKVTELPFDYDKHGYDTHTLLLIPSRRNLKRHAVWEIEEYIEYLKGESQIGEDTTLTLFFKDYNDSVSFDMMDYDVETKTLIGRGPYGREVKRKFNPKVTTDVASIDNVIKQDANGTFDLNGELIHTYSLHDLIGYFPNIFNEYYKNEAALYLDNNSWVKLTHGGLEYTGRGQVKSKDIV